MRGLAARIAGQLGVRVWELGAFGVVFAAGVILRFANLPTRSPWDSDQGTEMLAIRDAVIHLQIPTFGPEAISIGSPFHHGALYYDLLMPAAWLGNGDPFWVTVEIAALSLLVIPAVWWIARGIGGPVAGLTAALLAACSAALVGYSNFIWNPTLVEPAAAVAFLGAWQAVRGGNARWWVVAALGAVVAAQSHIAAGIIALPLAVTYLWDVKRSPGRRRGTLRWGVAAGAVVVVAYLPLILWELTHGFSETNGIVSYLAGPSTEPSINPIVRLVFASIRILAWPLTRWPIVDLKPAFGLAFLVAMALAFGLVWRDAATAKRRTAPDLDEAAPETPETPGAEPMQSVEHMGTRLIAAWLALIVVALGLGLRAVSQVNALPTEQYHFVADPLVFVAAGMIIGGLWRPIAFHRWTLVRRAVAFATVAAILGWNAGHWPPFTSPDGGWPAGLSAAQRIEAAAAGSPIALVPLFAEKGANAYIYPLERDGVSLVAPEEATVVVLLCDTYWLEGCAGAAENSWIATQAPTGHFTQIDRFYAAPDRVMTVYRRAP